MEYHKLTLLIPNPYVIIVLYYVSLMSFYNKYYDISNKL